MSGSALRLHATAILIGEDGVLIRGPSGSGKSALALALLAAVSGADRFAQLVADDTVLAEVRHGRLVARPHPATAGRIERRGVGLLAVPQASACVVRAVVDLAAPDEAAPERLPGPEAMGVTLATVALPRLRLRSHDPAGERVGPVLDFLGLVRTASWRYSNFAC